MFAENQAILQSVQNYSSSSNESDLSTSAKIIDDFRKSWINGVKGIEQVLAQLGVVGPSALSNFTSSASATGAGQQLQPGTQLPSLPKTENGNNTTQQLSFSDLSGIWSADDGGTYYIKQLGNTVWWLGLANDGESFSNVFKGIINNKEIGGEWSDVPKGTTRNHGTLNLNITYNSSSGLQLHKINQIGGFGASTWTRLEGENMSSRDNISLQPVQTPNKANNSGTEDLSPTSLNQDQKAATEVIASPNSTVEGFKIADETVKIKAGSNQFYNFEINPQVPSAKLAGAYRETSGNDVTVSLYETSSCNSGSSEQLDLTTCNVIHSETNPSGNIQLQLAPGKYYLVFATVDNGQDIKVKLHFEASKD